MKGAKKITNIKNAVSMIAAVALTIGFLAASAGDGKGENKNKKTTETAVSSESETTTVTTVTAEPIVTHVIPEMTCSQLELSDGNILFADSTGKYAIVDKEHKPVYSAVVTDDNGSSITVVCYNNSVSFQSGGQNIDSFVYSGKVVELKDGLIYVDKSLMEYRDTAFSAYRLSDKYTLECTAIGSYVIRKSDGKTTNSCKITDDGGITLTINATKNGFEAVNGDDLLELAVKLNGDLIVTSGSRVYINGTELVPPGHNDIFVNTTTTTTTTTTASSPTSTSAEDPDTETQTETQSRTPEEDDPFISDTPIEPSDPPSENGSVDTSNSNVSDITLEMLGYVNEIRRQYGLSEVYGLETLDAVAQKRADELLTEYSHNRPDGSNFDTAIDEEGLEWWHCAENIASGCPGMKTAKEAFDAWINSEGHRNNILNPKMKYMAAARSTRTAADGTVENFWEQIFFNDSYVPG
ncbi:MAG: hypothetical protein J5994_00575 [Ruminococcus sp.]|nr:hypothetical protein [Ruminococcus sp.]